MRQDAWKASFGDSADDSTGGLNKKEETVFVIQIALFIDIESKYEMFPST